MALRARFRWRRCTTRSCVTTSESKTYKPQLAESFTGNADSTEWTLKLHAGIKFTDGTDFNAEAVRFSLQRHRSGTANGPTAANCADFIACPRNSTATNVYVALMKDVQVVDRSR